MLEAAMADLTRSLGARGHDPALLVEIAWFLADDDDAALSASWLSDGCVDAPYEMTPSEVIAIVVGV